jgi:hypothetical protein
VREDRHRPPRLRHGLGLEGGLLADRGMTGATEHDDKGVDVRHATE